MFLMPWRPSARGRRLMGAEPVRVASLRCGQVLGAWPPPALSRRELTPEVPENRVSNNGSLRLQLFCSRHSRVPVLCKGRESSSVSPQRPAGEQRQAGELQADFGGAPRGSHICCGHPSHQEDATHQAV